METLVTDRLYKYIQELTNRSCNANKIYLYLQAISD